MRCRKEKKRKGWRWLLLFPVVIGLAGVFLFYFVFAIPSSEGMSLASWPARFTENFALFLETKDSEIVLTPAGKNQIETYGLWAQVLDKNNTEILSVNKPSSLTAHYTSAQLPIQIASSVIPYDWTFARLALCAFGLATLVLCALIAFTLWLSVRVENPYVTLLVLAGCLFIPAFIAPTGATGLFNKVLFFDAVPGAEYGNREVRHVFDGKVRMRSGDDARSCQPACACFGRGGRQTGMARA